MKLDLSSINFIWELLIFSIGAFGYPIAGFIQKAISNCPPNVFAVVFMISVFVFLYYIKSKFI